MKRRSSPVRKRRAVLDARYHVRAALKAVEKAAKLHEADVYEDLALAVKALRMIANRNDGDELHSVGVARGALRRMRLA